ncbi:MULTISPECIES: FAD-dependent oxidoreductase [unclassified Variovorax]|uniref:FAD-dependent oxidoreductase n=1 Tax=unclassified Variovorax TaxID=663243 RepID=UPI0032E62352
MENKVFEFTDYGQVEQITAEVCVIGSGCGGATLAYKLAEAGIDVVVIEKGGYYPSSTFDNRELNQAGKVDAERNLVTSTDGSTVLTYGELVGGTSVHYWADSYRTPEDRLSLWNEQYGITGHSAAELGPIFADVERRLSIQEHGPAYYNRMNELFRDAVDALGWTGAAVKSARKPCARSGHCMQGCRIDAKQSQLVTSIPAAMELGARIYADLKAQSFSFDGSQVTQLTASVIDRRRNRPSGKTVVIKAKQFVVAAGGFNTPAFLLAQSQLREALPALGKHFGMNPAVFAHGMFKEPIVLWRNIPVAYGSEHFRRASYDAQGNYVEGGYMLVPDQLQPAMMGYTVPGFDGQAVDWMANLPNVGGAIGWIDDHPDELGEIKLDSDGQRQVLYPYGPITQKMLRDVMKKAALINFRAGATSVMLPDWRRTTLSSAAEIDRIDALEIKPGSLMIAAPHPFGGCRMGKDPKTSVTDSSHRVHGMKNLFVSDPSVLPTGPSVDPSVTIMGFSYIAAEQVAQVLGKSTRMPTTPTAN